MKETPFDLRFRLFGTSVRVHPFFWLVTVFMNFELLTGPGGGIEVLLLWVLCVFVSILLHEFGHIWMGQVFGSHGHIQLQGMCGLAIGAKDGGMNRWQRIAVSLAGPGIQLLFFTLLVVGLNLLSNRPLPNDGSGKDLEDWFFFWWGRALQQDWPRLAILGTDFLLRINFWWAIINMLPVWPLDGGQVSRELFVWGSPVHGVRNSLALSFVTALVVAVNALSANMHGPTIPYVPAGGRFFIFFFALFAFDSFVNLQMENARTRGGWRDPDDDDRLPWERDPDEWKRG